MVERRLHGEPHVRLLHAFGKRIHGEPIGCVGLLATGEPANIGVGKLPDRALEFWLAGEHNLHSRREPLCHERHVEPGRPCPAAGRGDDHREHRPPGQKRPRADVGHVADDRRVLPLTEISDGMGAREVAVVSREVHERVADRDKPEMREFLGSRRPHARQPLKAGRKARFTARWQRGCIHQRSLPRRHPLSRRSRSGVLEGTRRGPTSVSMR